MDYIPQGIFTIADAKRGDIGNTSNKYAEAFLKKCHLMQLLSPYMGYDSVTPFLNHKDKWAILLASTSNIGALDFQELMIEKSGQKFYEKIIEISSKWGSDENLMYVVGATR